jgi:hypothetical protein
VRKRFAGNPAREMQAGASMSDEGLGSLANDGVWIAVLWHVAMAKALVALARGWRPSLRLAWIALSLPVATASALASTHRHPVDGAVLAILAGGLLVAGAMAPPRPVERAPAWMLAAGGLAVALGWIYPHFLEGRPLVVYLLAAPVGVVASPTLAVVVGFILAGGGLGSRVAALLVASVASVYAIAGVWLLRVPIDAGLLLAALLLASVAAAPASVRGPGGAAPARRPPRPASRGRPPAAGG